MKEPPSEDGAPSDLLSPRPEAFSSPFRPPPPGMERYSRSYREAAKALVGGIPLQLRHKGDVSSLPILLLYRHALELIIKEIVMSGGVPITTVLARSHDLREQMADLRKTADSIGVELKPETVEFILRTHQDDPKGDLVRYPMANKKTANKKEVTWQVQILKNANRFHLEPYVLEAERTLDDLQQLLDSIQARVCIGN